MASCGARLNPDNGKHTEHKIIDNVRLRLHALVMRDDIHKKVPRPPRVQAWVKRSINDADRLSGRALDALNEAIVDTWKREVSQPFLKGMEKEISATPGLFGHLGHVDSPLDIGGRGGHAECEILSETKRFLAMGQAPDAAYHNAIAGAIKGRVIADIRLTEPVLLGTGESKASVVLNHMRDQSKQVDYNAHTNSLRKLSSSEPVAMTRSALSADEDLLGRAPRGRP